ncbi:MAG: sulfatase [Bacteroidales bacterium]|nr:sulfatase [Bacteroidales bacterium]
MNKYSINNIKLVMLGAISLPILSQCIQKPEVKPNILFVAIDDLKPILACYGDEMVQTPNIDRIAENGTIFMQNYCQQAVCGPTRASLMTGMRPDHTGVWDLKTRMRDVHPDILSLPQHLISQGYTTQGIGKVYDPRCVDEYLDEPSWSIPFHKAEESYYSSQTGKPALSRYQLPETKALVEKYLKEAKEKGLSGSEANDYAQTFIKPSVESADVPDNAYNDGANTLKAKDLLIASQKDNKPFFLAVGLTKPHLPFASPKKYWDLYNREDMPLAPFQEHAKNGAEIAYHNSGEIRSYTDIPPLISFTDQETGIGLPIHKQKELIHGYYAAVSYADAQVGILLDALDSLGLTENTIIVLWGDHGWHLGDHDLWCKHTNFEQATRTPLLISAPGISPSKTNSPSEFIDIFPTLCDLAGIEIPVTLDGKSLVPMMKDPKAEVKEFSVSQYPRSGNFSEIERLGHSDGKYMGYSIRTKKYRYVVWMSNNFRSYIPFDESLIVARELYDYQADPNEMTNVVDEENYAVVSIEMHDKMKDFLVSQEDEKYQKSE